MDALKGVCECGRYAAGVCVACGRALCDGHAVEVEDRWHCRACIIGAAEWRVAVNEHRAAESERVASDDRRARAAFARELLDDRISNDPVLSEDVPDGYTDLHVGFVAGHWRGGILPGGRLPWSRLVSIEVSVVLCAPNQAHVVGESNETGYWEIEDPGRCGPCQLASQDDGVVLAAHEAAEGLDHEALARDRLLRYFTEAEVQSLHGDLYDVEGVTHDYFHGEGPMTFCGVDVNLSRTRRWSPPYSNCAACDDERLRWATSRAEGYLAEATLRHVHPAKS